MGFFWGWNASSLVRKLIRRLEVANIISLWKMNHSIKKSALEELKVKIMFVCSWQKRKCFSFFQPVVQCKITDGSDSIKRTAVGVLCTFQMKKNKWQNVMWKGLIITWTYYTYRKTAHFTMFGTIQVLRKLHTCLPHSWKTVLHIWQVEPAVKTPKNCLT